MIVCIMLFMAVFMLCQLLCVTDNNEKVAKDIFYGV